MSTEFQREDRYIVIKRSDLDKLSPIDRDLALSSLEHVDSIMAAWDCPARKCLVIESDWPEYEPTWAAIEARVTGKPAEQHQGEPVTLPSRINEMTADWREYRKAVGWNACLDEIAKLEPLYARPAPVQQGEPVAYLDIGAGGYMDLGTDLTDEQLAAIPKGRHMLGIVGTYGVDGYTAAPVAAQTQAEPSHGQPVASAKPVAYLWEGLAYTAQPHSEAQPLYPHADPGEVERLKSTAEHFTGVSIKAAEEVSRLRAKLAERDALLTRTLPYLSNTPDLVQHGAEDLAEEIRSTSAGRPCYGPNEWGTECGKCSKCKHASAEPPAQPRTTGSDYFEMVFGPEQGAPVERDDPVREALRAFVGAAYPVTNQINGRGHNWSEAYLDEALALARAALERKPAEADDLAAFNAAFQKAMETGWDDPIDLARQLWNARGALERKPSTLVDQLQADLTARDQQIDALRQGMKGDYDLDAWLAFVEEVPQLRLDAGRYRWLRSRDLEAISQGGVFAGMTPDNLVLNEETLDQAIDAAMAPDYVEASTHGRLNGVAASPCAGCGVPGYTGNCDKCIPY